MPSLSTYLVSCCSSCSSSCWSWSCDIVGKVPRITIHLMPSLSTYLVSCCSSCSSSCSSSSSSSSSSTSSPYLALYKDFTSASWSSSCDMLGGIPRVTTHLRPSFSTYLVSCP